MAREMTVLSSTLTELSNPSFSTEPFLHSLIDFSSCLIKKGSLFPLKGSQSYIEGWRGRLESIRCDAVNQHKACSSALLNNNSRKGSNPHTAPHWDSNPCKQIGKKSTVLCRLFKETTIPDSLSNLSKIGN